MKSKKEFKKIERSTEVEEMEQAREEEAEYERKRNRNQINQESVEYTIAILKRKKDVFK